MSDTRSETVASPFPVMVGYEIHAELRRDRLGVVYSARQVLHAREVALRLADESISGRDLTHVCKKARQAALAVHPHLLTPLEAGENDGQLYVVSQLASGPSLRQRLADGSLAPADAARLIATVARAVYHLHEHHALHLGLTSAGIFLANDNSPQVSDLGLSELLHDHPGSRFPGDPAYAAPEQLAMKKADVRSDVYALGCLLQECLMGSPSVPVAGRPTELERICRKALASRPDRRYLSAAELADDLDRFHKGESPSPGVFTLLDAWARRHATVFLVAVVLLAGLALSSLVLLTGKETTLRAEAERWHRQAERSALEGREMLDEHNRAKRRDADRLRAAEDKTQLAFAERDKERQRAMQEERQRRSAEKLTREQAQRRAQAEERARDSDAARTAAVAARAESARHLARLHVAHGTALMDTGDLSGALVPFVRALSVARAEKLPEEVHRLRIAAVLSRCPRPLTLLGYKKGDVQQVALSPDGKRFLVVGADGVVVVRTAVGGKLVGKRLIHGAAVALAVFSPDARRVLSADVMARVRIWKVEDGTEVFDAEALDAVPVHLSFSGDGKRFVTVVPSAMEPAAGEVQVRDSVTGEAIGEAVTENVAARPAALTNDGKRVLLCCSDRTARVYDVQTGKQFGPSLEHPHEVLQATYGSDGRLILTTCRDSNSRVWDSEKGKPIVAPLSHQHSTVSPMLDDSGRLILTANQDGAIRIRDVKTGKQIGPTLQSRTRLLQALFSPDGRYVLLSGSDGILNVHELLTGKSAQPPLIHSAPLRYAAFSPDASRVLTFDGRAIRVWDVTAAEPLAPVGPDVEAGVAYSADGSRLARIQADTVQVHEVVSGKVLGEALKHKGEVQRVLFSPSGKLLLTVSNPPDANATTPTWEMRVWDSTTGKSVSEAMEHLREVELARFAGEDRVLSVAKDKRVRLWEAKTGKQIGKPREHSDDVILAELTPDGRRVVTSDKEGMTRSWDAETGDRVGEGMGNAKPVRFLAIGSDSKSLATCCEDGTVRVWDLSSGRQLMQAEHADAVTHAAFSPDGKLLLTACADGTARAWTVATGKPLTPLMLHEQHVQRVAFSAEGRWILTAAGPFLRLWDSQSGEPIGPPLRHSWQATEITSIALSREGELTSEAGPGTRWTRKLVPDRRSDTDLEELAGVLSGREESQSGQLAPAVVGELESAWDHVAARNAREFDPPRTMLLAWARRGAAECEARALWAGARCHLDVLLDETATPELFARRARARAEMGQYASALADYTKALGASKSDWQWLAARGEVLVRLGKWDQAVADLSKATQQENRRPELWQKLGRAEAQRGEWKKAADAYAKAIRFGTEDPATWYEHALVQLSSGDVRGYRRTCARMIKKFGDREERKTRGILLDACTLAPEAVSDFKTLMAWAERDVVEFPANIKARVRLGAVLLRAAQPQKSSEILQRLAEAEGTGPTTAWLLVVAYRKTAQMDRAKEWQKKAAARKEGKNPSWQERQAIVLLQREAEAIGK
jgi:WD40 repeat protein/tetratricopeptide (TPR) repeat protein